MCYLQSIVMERREDDVMKMRLPDKHTGGQTDTGRSCSYVPLYFTDNAKKVAIGNSFSIICLHSYVIYTHTTKTVYVKGVASLTDTVASRARLDI